MRHEVNRFCGGWLAAAALAAIIGGCSNDGVSPEPDTVLATFTQQQASTSGSPIDMPNGVSIQFGVYSDPPDPSSDYPIPLPFGDKMMTRPGQSVSYSMTVGADPRTVAARLTDGDNEEIYYAVLFDGQPDAGFGSNESGGFTYHVSHSGPDLKGYVVTRFETTLDVFSLTQGSGTWTLTIKVTGKFYGHKV
jgi:hypothetical protein